MIHIGNMIFTLSASDILLQNGVFESICLKCSVNNTPESVKDKLFTHSFRGFVNFAKLTFLQNYKNECTMANCYICDKVQH